jgi:transmembrane sensor
MLRHKGAAVMSARNERSTDGDGPLARQAAQAWALRIETGAMDAEAWAKFALWIEADTLHGEAFNRVQAWLGEMDMVAPRLDDRAAMVFALSGKAPRRAVAASWPIPVKLAAGIAALAIGASTVWTLLSLGQGQTPIASHIESADGPRTVVLPDHTTVALNGRSALDFAFTAGRRGVKLRQGSEVDFDVAKDPKRPFIIDAGSSVIEVVGTAFDVKYLDRLTRISVSRGLVRVHDTGLQHDIHLTAGQAVAVDPSTGQWTLTRTKATAAAWRTGRLVYDSQPLWEVCADIERATHHSILLDPSIRQVSFSGVLRVSDPKTMMRTLELYLPIRTTFTQNQIRVVRRGAA